MEPAVTGLDWPFTTIPKSRECFAEQQLVEPPSLVRATSSCPGIDRPASGFNAVIPGPIKTLPLTKKCCEHIGFPTTTKLNSLASPQQRTPWPVFQDGRCNTSPILPYYNVTIDSFEEIHSLRATSGHHYLVSGTFHPPIGVLFSFPSRYFYSIGLETYLELGVDASHIHAQYPMDTTQEKIIHKTSKKHIYGTITLYGSKIPKRIRFIPRSLKVCLYTTSPTYHYAGFSLFYIGFARRY